MAIVLGWASATLGLWVASRVLSGVKLATFGDAIWAGALLGTLQWALHWVIFVALGVASLGIGFLLWDVTRWIASALVIMLAASLTGRVKVDGFFSALITAFMVAAAGSVLHWVL